MASLTREAFAKRWAGSRLSERSGYQQHFLDLCDVLGAPKPAEMDPHGEFYTFEKGVERWPLVEGVSQVLCSGWQVSRHTQARCAIGRRNRVRI